ncbi:hypothetical protein [Microbacterium sp. Se5.02b]|uniref:hypothetical protein n=1 Tax=Microbacterium sp. Se63.02b TaxID=2709304 RepID=UPI002867B1D1|nr:hypothetical protein [Microbacterium sp. Se5.02b]
MSVAVHNHGTRVLHAVLRDAWQPTAGAPTERQQLHVPSGERGRVEIPLLPAAAANWSASS